MPKISALWVGLFLMFASFARAWEPASHIYFADIALEDALDDGVLTIPLLGSGGEITFDVFPSILQALDEGKAAFRAGALGPDAYPDMVTGLRVFAQNEANGGAIGGTNAWLQFIWNTFGSNRKEQAFRLGLLTHAAGDMYAASFADHFIGVGPEGRLKRDVIENYIRMRLPLNDRPADFWNVSIEGLEFKIYQTMVDASGSSAVDSALLLAQGPAADAAPPRVFSTLKSVLTWCIDQPFSDCSAPNWYLRPWVRVVDRAMRSWPGTNHQIAVELHLRQGGPDFAAAQAHWRQWQLEFGPDLVKGPGGLQWIVTAVARVLTERGFPTIAERSSAVMRLDLDSFVQDATGHSWETYQKIKTRPQDMFDATLALPGGVTTTRDAFDKDYLMMGDGEQHLAYSKVPAAYNSVILSKLVLLTPDQITDLVARLGGSVEQSKPNVMLGFLESMNAPAQWRNGLVLAENCAVYTQLFMTLPGDGGC